MPDELGRVAGLWRYPVKSLRGEALERIELNERGVVGDREWALVNPRGKLASGKTTRRFRKVLGLMHHSARYEGEIAVLAPAGGPEVRADDPASAETARLLAGEGWRLAREDKVPHHDAAALHLVTNVTLASLASAAGHPVEVDRLRPNILVQLDAPCPFPEDGWVGDELVIGGARLLVGGRTKRCVMPTHAQAGLVPRERLLKTIGKVNKAYAGVYLSVIEPGPIRAGDPVRRG